MHWVFLNTGYNDGRFNMSFDESLALSLVTGGESPAVRVYGWRPPAISFGWNQRPEEIDTLKAERDGMDVVRRPTGGRAILHSEELTYSVAMVTTAKNIQEVYNDISRALVLGLKKLGADVALVKSQPHFPTLYKSTSSAACFSSSARYEIQINGKKLVGSAQRRYIGKDANEVVLQHGSLLLGPDHKRLTDYLMLQDDRDRARLKQDMNDKTTDLSEALEREVSFEECAEAVKFGFEKAWQIRFETTSPESIMSGANA